MMSNLLQSALKLSPAERILLAEQIWDSVAEESSAPDLDVEQKAELGLRLKRLEETGPQGRSWAQVKNRVLRRRKR